MPAIFVVTADTMNRDHDYHDYCDEHSKADLTEARETGGAEAETVKEEDDPNRLMETSLHSCSTDRGDYDDTGVIVIDYDTEDTTFNEASSEFFLEETGNPEKDTTRTSKWNLSDVAEGEDEDEEEDEEAEEGGKDDVFAMNPHDPIHNDDSNRDNSDVGTHHSDDKYEKIHHRFHNRQYENNQFLSERDGVYDKTSARSPSNTSVRSTSSSSSSSSSIRRKKMWDRFCDLKPSRLRSRESLVFKALDVDNDGALSKNEIVQWVRENPMVWTMLSVNLNLDEAKCVDIVSRAILNVENDDRNNDDVGNNVVASSESSKRSEKEMTWREIAAAIEEDEKKHQREEEGQQQQQQQQHREEEELEHVHRHSSVDEMEEDDGVVGSQREEEPVLTKEQFKHFKSSFVDDPKGSQEFFHRLVFAAFDDDDNNYLDREEFDRFLDVFYEKGSIFRGDSRLPGKETLKEIAYTRLDANGDGRFEFEEIRSLISGSALQSIHSDKESTTAIMDSKYNDLVI